MAKRASKSFWRPSILALSSRNIFWDWSPSLVTRMPCSSICPQRRTSHLHPRPPSTPTQTTGVTSTTTSQTPTWMKERITASRTRREWALTKKMKMRWNLRSVRCLLRRERKKRTWAIRPPAGAASVTEHIKFVVASRDTSASFTRSSPPPNPRQTTRKPVEKFQRVPTPTPAILRRVPERRTRCRGSRHSPPALTWRRSSVSSADGRSARSRTWPSTSSSTRTTARTSSSSFTAVRCAATGPGARETWWDISPTCTRRTRPTWAESLSRWTAAPSRRPQRTCWTKKNRKSSRKWSFITLRIWRAGTRTRLAKPAAVGRPAPAWKWSVPAGKVKSCSRCPSAACAVRASESRDIWIYTWEVIRKRQAGAQQQVYAPGQRSCFGEWIINTIFGM